MTLLTEQVEKLMYELSMWRCSPELLAAARAVQAKHAAGAEGEFLETKRNTYDVVFMSINEPFRLVLSDVRARLAKTKEALHHCLEHAGANVCEALAGDSEAYSDAGGRAGRYVCFRQCSSTYVHFGEVEAQGFWMWTGAAQLVSASFGGCAALCCRRGAGHAAAHLRLPRLHRGRLRGQLAPAGRAAPGGAVAGRGERGLEGGGG